ncbi:MAG: DNA polymerase III subunit delta, partial [Rhodobacteraceae bacterium]|nr:DNA polymerase III subunit delta [Paracoccaceae bacterium]
MKLNGPAAAKLFARPDPSVPAVLIFGADPMRVAMKRQEILANILGPKGEEEMRLTRLPASDLRKDGA